MKWDTTISVRMMCWIFLILMAFFRETVHDIEIGKCSWLATTCMRRANDLQKQIMNENYGKNGEN